MSVFKRELFDDEHVELPAHAEKDMYNRQERVARLTSDLLEKSERAQHVIDNAVEANLISSSDRGRLTLEGSNLLGGMISNLQALAEDDLDSKKKGIIEKLNGRYERSLKLRSDRWKHLFGRIKNPALASEVAADGGSVSMQDSRKQSEDEECGMTEDVERTWILKQVADSLLSDLQVQATLFRGLEHLDRRIRAEGKRLPPITEWAKKGNEGVKTVATALSLHRDWEKRSNRYDDAAKSLRGVLNSLFVGITEEDREVARAFADKINNMPNEYLDSIRHENTMGLAGHRLFPSELLTEYRDAKTGKRAGKMSMEDLALGLSHLTRMDELRAINENLWRGLGHPRSPVSRSDPKSAEYDWSKKPSAKELLEGEGLSYKTFCDRAEKLNYTLNLLKDPSECIDTLKSLIDESAKVSQTARAICNSYIKATPLVQTAFSGNEYPDLTEVKLGLDLMKGKKNKKTPFKRACAVLGDLHQELSEIASSYDEKTIETVDQLITGAKSGANFVGTEDIFNQDDPKVQFAHKVFSAKSQLDLNHLLRSRSQLSGEIFDNSGDPLHHMTRSTRFAAQRKFKRNRNALSKTSFKDVTRLSDLVFELEALEVDGLDVELSDPSSDDEQSTEDLTRKTYKSWAEMLTQS